MIFVFQVKAGHRLFKLKQVNKKKPLCVQELVVHSNVETLKLLTVTCFQTLLLRFKLKTTCENFAMAFAGM
jgi:hypothetical protein